MTMPRGGRVALRVLAALLLGALAGAIVAVRTPTHLEIAGSDATVSVHPGRAYDRIALSANLLVGTRATSRSVLGEPLGISVDLDLDPSTFVAPDGSFDANVVPAYVQAYSDPAQLTRDIRWALTKHVLSWLAAGSAAALLIWLATRAYRVWRERRLHRLDDVGARSARAVLSDVGVLRRRTALAVVVLAVLAVMPSSRRRAPDAPALTPSPLLAGTAFSGTQVSGLLQPALSAVRSYIETYISQTNSYYDQLRTKVLSALDGADVQVPSDPDVTSFVFVTDRHCNIGMDRVIVALADHVGSDLIVSGGDDAFSGTFPFESVCTKNLAAKSQQAGMTDVFVSGNHDSAITRADEARQHIEVLGPAPVVADGLTFVGLPDPRTSRYGQGIRPSSDAAQARVLTAQGRATGKIACGLDGPVVAVLHDPLAGRQAAAHGCGRITVALDGHTHRQIGPTELGRAANGTQIYQYVGASTGGAPGEGAVERTFASRLTVGPLNHDAALNIVSIDKRSGALVGVSAVHVTPQQDVSIESLPVG